MSLKDLVVEATPCESTLEPIGAAELEARLDEIVRVVYTDAKRTGPALNGEGGEFGEVMNFLHRLPRYSDFSVVFSRADGTMEVRSLEGEGVFYTMSNVIVGYDDEGDVFSARPAFKGKLYVGDVPDEEAFCAAVYGGTEWA